MPKALPEGIAIDAAHSNKEAALQSVATVLEFSKMTKLQMIPWKNIQPLLIVLLDEVAVSELQIEEPAATGVEHSAGSLLQVL